jgi:hypothetical protein
MNVLSLSKISYKKISEIKKLIMKKKSKLYDIGKCNVANKNFCTEIYEK